jgi:undecaprenyl-phosphate 4-deoxy-4-formamido-L-arabinose transferase
MGNGDHSISVVVPVYNAGRRLESLVCRLRQSLTRRGVPYELILVDDDSADDTWRVLEQMHEAFSDELHIIRLARNYGQHNALLCGIRCARFALIVTMDDDLQHPPEEIGSLLNRLHDGLDVVYGTPQRAAHHWIRQAASRIGKHWIEEALGVPHATEISAFRVFRTRLRDAFASHVGPCTCIDALLQWGTTRIAAVAVRHERRVEGRSSYTLRKLMQHAMNMVISFNASPLRWLASIGMTATIGGLAFVTLLWQIGRDWPLLPAALVMAGVSLLTLQLFGLTIIAEYMRTLHGRISRQPSYCVAEQRRPSASPGHRRFDGHEIKLVCSA